MKIGLNATCLNDRPSGARQRFLGIYRELAKQMPDDEFIVFEPVDCRVGTWFEGAPNVSARPTPLPSEGRAGRFLAGLGYWRAALEKESLDIFECFNMPLVTSPSARNVMTIHDVRGLHRGGNPFARMLFKNVLDSACTRADQVITVSEAVKQEVLEACPQANVAVIHNGLDVAGFVPLPADVVQRTLDALALPAGFLLAVGHFESRKNYLALVDALALLRDRGDAVRLVIIGNDSGGKAIVEDRIRQRGLQASVTLLSGVTDIDLRCAYQACKAFVFPSTYEGFGIPVLEAMASGRPMVLSDIPVFREIMQGQGIYFPPHDIEAMAAAIECVCSSSSSENHRQLVDQGRRRLDDFCFEALASQVKVLYAACGRA